MDHRRNQCILQRVNMQLDMFCTEEILLLKKQMEKLETSNTQVRKGLFARNTNLEKKMDDLYDKVDTLERENYRLKQMIFERKSHSSHLMQAV